MVFPGVAHILLREGSQAFLRGFSVQEDVSFQAFYLAYFSPRDYYSMRNIVGEIGKCWFSDKF